MHAVDEAIRNLVEARGRLVSRCEVLGVGGADDLIENRLERGVWRQVHAGVYVVGIGVLRWDERVLAAVLAGGDGSFVSHRAAAVLLGLDGLAGAPVEITVHHETTAIRIGAVVHRSRRIEPVTMAAGVPVSGVERTLLELGAVVPPVVVEKAYASAVRVGLTTPAKCQLYVEHSGGRGRKGTRLLRQVIARYADGRMPSSGGEVEFLRLLRAAGVPDPVRQHEVKLTCGDVAVVDFAWPERRKCVEFVSRRWHSDARAIDHDTWRENRIRDAGWDLRSFTTGAVRSRPEAVAAAVIRFLGV